MIKFSRESGELRIFYVFFVCTRVRTEDLPAIGSAWVWAVVGESKSEAKSQVSSIRRDS